MIRFFERIGFVQQEASQGFQLVPAIFMMVLMLTFMGTTLYILISSLS